MMNASCLKSIPEDLCSKISVSNSPNVNMSTQPNPAIFIHDWPLMESTILKKKLHLNVAIPNDPNSNVTIINGSYMN